MPKNLLCLVVLVLTSCLVVDPVLSAGFPLNTGTSLHSPFAPVWFQSQALSEPGLWMHTISRSMRGFKLRQITRDFLQSLTWQPSAMTDIGVPMPIRMDNFDAIDSERPAEKLARTWNDPIDWLMHAPEPEVRAVLGHREYLMRDVLFVRASGGASTIVDYEKMLLLRQWNIDILRKHCSELAHMLGTRFHCNLTTHEKAQAHLLMELRNARTPDQPNITIASTRRNNPTLWDQFSIEDLHELEAQGYLKSIFRTSDRIIWRIPPKGEWLISKAALAASQSNSAPPEAWRPPATRPDVPPRISSVSEERVEQLRAAWKTFREQFPNATIGAAQALAQSDMISEESLLVVENFMKKIRGQAASQESRDSASVASQERVQTVRAEWDVFSLEVPKAPMIAAALALADDKVILNSTLDLIERHMKRQREIASKQAARRALKNLIVVLATGLGLAFANDSDFYHYSRQRLIGQAA
jgi:hypothetical protein